MKIAIKEIALVILALIGAVFFIQTIFGKSDEGNLSVFDGVTGIIEQINSTEPKNESVDYLQSQGMVTEPGVKYIFGSASAGTEVSFKEMFEVKIGAQSFQGNEENGFAIYLMDIRDLAGNSRLVSLDSESIDASDEIESDFVYDKDEDILFIHNSGCYKVFIKVYTDAGSVTTYEFFLPVE